VVGGRIPVVALPSVTKPEDLEESYSVTKVLELAYRMGLPSRAEYRKLLRVGRITPESRNYAVCGPTFSGRGVDQ
jgi:hypothetical protein